MELWSLHEINLASSKEIWPFTKFLLVISGTPSPSTYFGVSWVPSRTSKASCMRTHSHPVGRTNSFSIFEICGSGLPFLIFRSFTNRIICEDLQLDAVTSNSFAYDSPQNPFGNGLGSVLVGLSNPERRASRSSFQKVM